MSDQRRVGGGAGRDWQYGDRVCVAGVTGALRYRYGDLRWVVIADEPQRFGYREYGREFIVDEHRLEPATPSE